MLDFIEVEINAIEVAAGLGNVADKQIPFAMAATLTELAATAKKAEEKEMNRVFTLRNTFSNRGIQINRAEKKAWPHLYSEVGIEKAREYLIDHIVGAKREGNPTHGRAVLQAGFESEARTRSGKVKASKKPSRLVAIANKKRKARKGKRRKAFTPKHRVPSKPFIINASGYRRGQGNDLIVRRVEEDRRGELEILFAFEMDVDIKKEYDFESVARRSVNSHYDRVFGQWMAKAVGSYRER